MPNCEDCAWTDSSECRKSKNEMNIMCDGDCFLPYPAEYFKEEGKALLLNNEGNFQTNYTDPAMEAAQSFINFHSNNFHNKCYPFQYCSCHNHEFDYSVMLDQDMRNVIRHLFCLIV